MCRAWAALDTAAEAAGHAPLSPEIWEARMPDGAALDLRRFNLATGTGETVHTFPYAKWPSLHKEGRDHLMLAYTEGVGETCVLVHSHDNGETWES
jgi:hypothetical protein